MVMSMFFDTEGNDGPGVHSSVLLYAFQRQVSDTFLLKLLSAAVTLHTTVCYLLNHETFV
jgi:hypothetical protein